MIQELFAAGRYQKCLQACQHAMQCNALEAYAYKYGGKSELALGQLKQAQLNLVKAHQLDSSDPEVATEIGNIFLNDGNKYKALEWYQKALEVNNSYAPALSSIAYLKSLSGNNDQAVELFQRAIHADPSLGEAYLGAATSFLALGHLDQAELYAERALGLNQIMPSANEIIGIAYQRKNNLSKATESYQKEIKINPFAAKSLLNLGILHLQSGKILEALASFAKVSSIDESEQCSLLMAQAYQKLGKYQEAIIHYKKISITPLMNKLIPFNLGLCFLNIGQSDDAIKAFHDAILLDDTFVAAWGNIGTCLKQEGHLKEAIHATRKVLELDPGNLNALLNLGSIYMGLGELNLALEFTLKSIELNPYDSILYMNLGSIYKDLGRLDLALESIHKSIQLNPDNPISYINLGSIYKDLGELNLALESIHKSIELNPDNAISCLNLGGIYKDLGELDLALEFTLKSIELNPNNPISYMNLGSIYKDMGNPKQALQFTLKSLELKPDSSISYMNLGSIYKDLGQPRLALEFTLKSIELNPDNPTCLINLGGIYIEIGELDQAFLHLRNALKYEQTNEQAVFLLAETYYLKQLYVEAIQVLGNVKTREQASLLLSLYLAINNKNKFNVCARELIEKNWFDSRSIAAIDHANVLYNQAMDNGLNGNSFDTISTQNISENEISETLFNEMLAYLSDMTLHSRFQKLLINGTQTSGNIFDTPKESFRVLLKLLITKIEKYNLDCNVNTDKSFMTNWNNKLYTLRGWAIVMGKGGSLLPHNHEHGWLTGTFYLQLPEIVDKANDGAIEFSHKGPQYPHDNIVFDKKVLRPKVRDLNIFSSSLFHRTLPFQSTTQRICIAFDLRRR